MYGPNARRPIDIGLRVLGEKHCCHVGNTVHRANQYIIQSGFVPPSHCVTVQSSRNNAKTVFFCNVGRDHNQSSRLLYQLGGKITPMKHAMPLEYLVLTHLAITASLFHFHVALSTFYHTKKIMRNISLHSFLITFAFWWFSVQQDDCFRPLRLATLFGTQPDNT